MEVFTPFLAKIDNPTHKERTETLLLWIKETFPDLEQVLKWNQPMFTDHGTYIIGFSASKKHLAVAPETATIKRFAKEIEAAGYSYTDNIIRINWEQPIDHSLLKQMIEFNLIDKAGHTNFWR